MYNVKYILYKKQWVLKSKSWKIKRIIKLSSRLLAWEKEHLTFAYFMGSSVDKLVRLNEMINIYTVLCLRALLLYEWIKEMYLLNND